MQREEKQLEATVDTLLQRVADIKASLQSLLIKLDLEPDLQWPSVLDSYALISGQLSMLLKLLRNEKTPPLRNYVTLPLLLSPETDENLFRLTEARVRAFSHDIVPDLLRTKTDPDIESKQNQVETRAASIPHDTAQKQINTLNKIVNNVLDTIESSQREWESDSSTRGAGPVTYNNNEFHALLRAVYYGTNLKPGQAPPPGSRPGPGGPPPPSGPGGMGGGKAPSAIKTNIRAANPYGR